MRLLSKEGEVIADIALAGGKDRPLSAAMSIGDTTINSPDLDVSIAKGQDGLEVSIRIPGAVNFKVLLEKDDVKTLKGLMNKDALGFFMKAMF